VCGGFAAVDPAGRRYRSIAAQSAAQQHAAAARRAAANAGSATFLQLIKRLKTVCLKIFVSSLLELTSKTDDSWGN